MQQQTVRRNTSHAKPKLQKIQKQTHLVLGHLGEIGRTIWNMLEETGDEVYGIDLTDQYMGYNAIRFIHVCIPYSDEFVKIVCEYAEIYTNPNTIIIIHSSVVPGTTARIAHYYDQTVYSPVRGMHRDGKFDGMMEYTKFFATTKKSLIPWVRRLYDDMKIFSLGLLTDPANLELGKFANTLWYFKEIVFAQALVLITEEYGLDISIVKKFIEDTGNRPILPYAQKVGGHCVIQNAELIEDVMPLAKMLLQHDKLFARKFDGEKKDIPLWRKKREKDA